MAGDWIKMNKSLPRDPRVVRISSALKADRLRTIGGLLSAWCLFDEQTEDGTLEGYTPEILDELVGLPGLAQAMATVGWLDIGADFIAAPRFDEHNGQSAKRRAQDCARKMSARKADKRPHDERTKSGLEKRREEKSIKTLPLPPLMPESERAGEPALPEVKPTGRVFPDHAATIAKINGLRTEWAKPSHWSAAEMHALHDALAGISELEADDWQLLTKYLAAKVDKAAGYWQPRSRCKFLESFPDVFAGAQRWAGKTGNVEKPKPAGGIWK